MDTAILAGKSYTVIGDPVDHSKSPQMQNAAFRFYALGEPYGKLAVHIEELPEFFEFARKNLLGVNITVPLKEHAAQLVDTIDEYAKRSSSVNTLVIKNGRIHGLSTDGVGLQKALYSTLNFTARNRSCTIIGAGGAAAAAAFQLAQDGASSIAILNRSSDKAALLAERIAQAYPAVKIAYANSGDADAVANYCHKCDLLLHATTLGWHDGDPAPLELPKLNAAPGQAFFDLVYRDNALQQQAKNFNWRVADGKSMLLYQGAASFEAWTGKSAPLEAMQKALKEA